MSLKDSSMIGKCHITFFQCLIESSVFKTKIDVIIMSQRLIQVYFLMLTADTNFVYLKLAHTKMKIHCLWLHKIYKCSLMNHKSWKKQTNISKENRGGNKIFFFYYFFFLWCSYFSVLLFLWSHACFTSLAYKVTIKILKANTICFCANTPCIVLTPNSVQIQRTHSICDAVWIQ